MRSELPSSHRKPTTLITNTRSRFYPTVLSIETSYRQLSPGSGSRARSTIRYPVHRQPVFARLYDSDAAILPIVDDLVTRVLSIPVHHGLSDTEAERVAEAIALACADRVPSGRT